MRWLSLALVLSLTAQAAAHTYVTDGGVEVDVPVLDAADAGVDLKCYGPTERRNIAATITEMSAENAKLRDDVKAAPSPLLVTVLVVAGVLVGGAAGYGISRAVK